MGAIRRRASSMAELAQIQSGMMGEESARSIRAFKPRADDVIISPYGKCGTTWLQQMVHTLRTRGDTDYDDISRVVPWIETAAVLGIDLEAPQKAEPRAFKSHLSWDLVPKGARYIVSIRNPKDAVVSAFRFMEGWFVEPGAISIGEFARGRYLQRGEGRDYWHHLASWWRVRDRDDVLVLSYEGMHRDPSAAVRRVAAFADIPLDGELLLLTLQRTSLEYMLANKSQFDDLLMREMTESRLNLPPGSDSAKVRAGKVGSHRVEMPPDVAAELDQIWRDAIGAEFGYGTYEDLEQEL